MENPTTDRKVSTSEYVRAATMLDRLRVLHRLHVELMRTESFDEFCRQAVEMGRERLGFDRMSLWFYDRQTGCAKGSFGTDEQGQTRDERNAAYQPEAINFASDAFKDIAVHELHDIPLLNANSEVVGRGWQLFAVLRDGDDCIGWLTVDNLLSQRPVAPGDSEIMALYGLALGHLIVRKRTEETLKTERNRLRAVIDALPDGVYVKDIEGRYTLVNETLARESQQRYGVPTMIGRTNDDLLPPEDAAVLSLLDKRLFETGQPQMDIEEHIDTEAHSSRWMLTTKVPLRDESGQVVNLIGVMRDITMLKEVQQQAVELAVTQERVKLLKEIMSNLSHDFRTPLSVINSSLYLLERADTPERQRAHIASIAAQTALLSRFIEDILTVARLESQISLPMMPLTVTELLDNLETRFRVPMEQKGIHFQVKADDPHLSILAEPTNLTMALANLLRNALDYTPSGGSVVVQVRALENQVAIEVIDTGIGIASDDQQRIFDYFFRVDPARTMDRGGTGLGLAIARRVIDLHAGQLEVSSTAGGGSTFRVLLARPPAG